MNIGCYIVTNGQYAVTIPPNTIIQPGQYFLLSGQDILAKNCGNTDSAVHVNLNWNTCNCTDKTIPATGDGFMQNGGSANEKIVLLDPNLNVIDAISRQSTPSSSVSITSSGLAGGCTSKTFDLGSMGITYETIGQSTGIDNSFARKVDGDCGWVKTTAISANAPNKTGSSASATYSFTTLSASQCNSTTGSISIDVSGTNVASLFPMSYTLAFDRDANYIFNSSDDYTFGVDNTASSIDIDNLVYGRYRITVASALGCNLKTYDFFIFNCYGILLPFKLVSFTYNGIKDESFLFESQVSGIENLKTLVLEGSEKDTYTSVTTITNASSLYKDGLINLKIPVSSYRHFRLRMVDNRDVVSYSPVVSTGITAAKEKLLWPNPAKEKINISFHSEVEGMTSFTISNALGLVLKREAMQLKKGSNSFPVSTGNLPPGIYHLSISQKSSQPPISFRFVKQ